MREKRKDKRNHSFYYLKLIDTATGRQSGNLVDISSGGIGIVSSDRNEVDTVKRLRLMLPETTFGRDWVEFKARTMWCRKDINPSLFASGMKFEEMDEEETIIMHRALEDHLFKN